MNTTSQIRSKLSFHTHHDTQIYQDYYSKVWYETYIMTSPRHVFTRLEIVYGIRDFSYFENDQQIK